MEAPFLNSALYAQLVRTQRLPSPSTTALKILELAESPDVSVKQISELILTDPAMSARLLKYANSPMVGPRSEITSVQQAVTMLGIRSVKVTALGFSLVRKSHQPKCPHFNYDIFWAHATAIATAARGIMAVGCPARADEAFTAGLLARIGRLAFVTAMPEEYDGVLARLPNLMTDGIDEEKAVLGESHVEIGADLLAQWKLPALLVDSVRYQLNPAAAPTAEVRQIAEAILHAKYIADVLCGLSKGSEGNRPQQVVEISVIEGQFRQTAGMLDISLDELPDPEVIEDQARDLAERLNVAGGLEVQKLADRAQKLESQAITDGLTGLTNRKGFDARLAAEVERSRRHGRPLALLMLDLDHFKQVNDAHGHLIGDEVLKQVGRVLKETVRKCDYAARYGGEEFAVIAAESELPAAASLAERLRIAISGISISVASGAYSPTVSIGIGATSMPTEALTAEMLIAQADKLLYEAKRSGRNQCKSGPIGKSGRVKNQTTHAK